MKKYDKILLCYSGGLDTTVAIPWLMEKTGAKIYAVGGNVGQPENLEAATEKALNAGAEKAVFLDLNKEYADEYILPAGSCSPARDNQCP